MSATTQEEYFSVILNDYDDLTNRLFLEEKDETKKSNKKKSN